ncbi:MAG: GNAT family protein [Chlorobium sp.]|nr:MAG: GNAT family N-acetyltransferase [Chlorobium sp.]
MLSDEMPLLFGEKVLLRPFTQADIDDRYIGWLNDPAVVRLSNQRFRKHDRESSMRYLSSFSGTGNFFLSARAMSDHRQLGTLTAYLSLHHGTIDVGIMIGDKSVWGQGYGQDAWNTLTIWLLKQKGIRKLTAGTTSVNYGMIKLMERSGMTLEAVRKEQELVAGVPVDLLYYAKFRQD